MHLHCIAPLTEIYLIRLLLSWLRNRKSLDTPIKRLHEPTCEQRIDKWNTLLAVDFDAVSLSSFH